MYVTILFDCDSKAKNDVTTTQLCEKKLEFIKRNFFFKTYDL
jgi:hypothetical protein